MSWVGSGNSHSGAPPLSRDGPLLTWEKGQGKQALGLWAMPSPLWDVVFLSVGRTQGPLVPLALTLWGPETRQVAQPQRVQCDVTPPGRPFLPVLSTALSRTSRVAPGTGRGGSSKMCMEGREGQSPPAAWQSVASLTPHLP